MAGNLFYKLENRLLDRMLIVNVVKGLLGNHTQPIWYSRLRSSRALVERLCAKGISDYLRVRRDYCTLSAYYYHKEPHGLGRESSQDYEDNLRTTQEESDKLSQISREIEDGTAELIEYDSKQFSEELGLPEKTPEENEQIRKLQEQIMVLNYNEMIRIYNILRNQGVFS